MSSTKTWTMGKWPGGNKKPNPMWNQVARHAEKGGIAGLAVAGYMDYNRMANSSDEFHEGFLIVAEWAGAIAGGYAGAKIGAAIGTAICPGAGTLIGAILGGLIGAGVGSELGNEFISAWDRKPIAARSS